MRIGHPDFITDSREIGKFFFCSAVTANPALLRNRSIATGALKPAAAAARGGRNVAGTVSRRTYFIAGDFGGAKELPPDQIHGV
jgi:hypothetical protein